MDTGEFSSSCLHKFNDPVSNGQAKKYNLANTYSNYSSILTYDENGYTDYSDLLTVYDEASDRASEQAGRILKENLQDPTARTGYAMAGWRPRKDDMKAQAVEWWNWGESTVHACMCAHTGHPANSRQTGRVLHRPRQARLSLV